ncbi:unnamed protein product [Trichobilharzia regenti]|nr:unnamed protein product [Trichobilharzia regenti]
MFKSKSLSKETVIIPPTVNPLINLWNLNANTVAEQLTVADQVGRRILSVVNIVVLFSFLFVNYQKFVYSGFVSEKKCLEPLHSFSIPVNLSQCRLNYFG